MRLVLPVARLQVRLPACVPARRSTCVLPFILCPLPPAPRFAPGDFRTNTTKRIPSRHGTMAVFALERHQELHHAVFSESDLRLSFGVRLSGASTCR